MNLRITPASAAKTGYRHNLAFIDWFKGGQTPVATIKPYMQGTVCQGALLVLKDGTLPFFNATMLRRGRKTPSNMHLFPNRNAAKAYLKEHFSREFDGSYSNWKEACPVWEGYKKDTSSQKEEEGK